MKTGIKDAGERASGFELANGSFTNLPISISPSSHLTGLHPRFLAFFDAAPVITLMAFCHRSSEFPSDH